MAFNETFWVVIATSALVIALASVVASGDSYKMREFFGSLKSHPNSHVRKIEARNTREINTVLIWAIINNLAQAYAFMTAVLNISTRSELPFDQISSLICEIGGLLAIILINSYVSRMQYIFERTQDSMRLAGYIHPGTAKYAIELRATRQEFFGQERKKDGGDTSYQAPSAVPASHPAAAVATQELGTVFGLPVSTIGRACLRAMTADVGSVTDSG